MKICYNSQKMVVTKNNRYKEVYRTARVRKKGQIITILLLLFVVTVSFFLVYKLYDESFVRIDNNAFEDLNISPTKAEYEDLQRNQYSFFSDKGQNLVGYNYFKTNNPKALIVLVHGLGESHEYYKPFINSLANHNYWIFAFDGTGHGESDGNSQIGLEQHVIDLQYAIDFLNRQKEFHELKVSLLGHSWGGYAVSAILNIQPNVKSVISISGFSKALDLELDSLQDTVGIASYLAIPQLTMNRYLRFGKYASYTGLEGFRNSDTPGFIISSKDDTIVKPKYGYKLYQDNLPQTRLQYEIFDSRGHLPFLSDDAYKKRESFMSCFFEETCENEEDQQLWNEVLNRIYDKYSLTEEDMLAEHPDAWQYISDFANSMFTPEFWQNAIDEDLVTDIDEFIVQNL